MPHKFDDLYIKSREKGIDYRVKLSSEDKKKIIDLHNEGQSIHSLSNLFKVSRRLIQFILYPERQDRQRELLQERGGIGIYYKKEKHREYMRIHRKHKKMLYENGYWGGTKKV